MKIKKISVILSALLIAGSIGSATVNAKTNTDSMSVNQQNLLKQGQAKVDKSYNLFINTEKNKKIIYKDKKAVKTNGINLMESSGTYPTRSGVILVTSDSNTLGIHYGHAGIVWNPSTTVESMSDGVQRLPNMWNSRYNNVQGISVSETTSEQDEKASDWCDTQVGKPYNWNFFNTSTRNKFYCSQLVWAAYKDLYNINIDSKSSIPGVIIPVDLPNQPNVYTVYVK